MNHFHIQCFPGLKIPEFLFQVMWFMIKIKTIFTLHTCFSSRFSVNLQCGSRSDANVAIHINPRYDSHPGYVVLNTLQYGSWGSEERNYNSPFPAGSSFTLVIAVGRDTFQVRSASHQILTHRIYEFWIHKSPTSLKQLVFLKCFCFLSNQFLSESVCS